MVNGMREMSREMAKDILRLPGYENVHKPGTFASVKPQTIQYTDKELLQKIKHFFPEVEKII